MLKARLDKSRRLLDVSQGLQRLEEERIAALRVRLAEIAASREVLVNSLNADGDLQGLLLPAIVKRLKSLGEEELRVAAEIEHRTKTLRELAARTKHAERLSRTYEQEHDRVLAAQELRDVIEGLARPKDASLP